MITKLAWKNIWFKPLNTVLSVILLTSSVAIITTLILVEKQFEEKFSSNIENVDLVLGAQGSPLQLILSSVYQVDTPPGNISYDSAKVWMNHPFVEKAIPLAFGDNYRGYKILGTTTDYLAKFNAKVIDGTGKNVTAGIIDEHSHIASASTNEGGQSVTSEVRIQDNINPDDIDIYRQLSGGVTTSHILHGSANTIGGQTQLIKLRWGADDAGLLFKGADPFIKFALGENVKRTSSTQGNNR